MSEVARGRTDKKMRWRRYGVCWHVYISIARAIDTVAIGSGALGSVGFVHQEPMTTHLYT